jgi:hypothetical protein
LALIPLNSFVSPVRCPALLLFYGSAIPINWAKGDEPRLVIHSETGSLTLVPGGDVTEVTGASDAKNTAVRIAHGVLMALAFVLCFPSGALLARHKWLVGQNQVSRPAEPY